MSEKIAIGILAYNEKDYIEDVVNSLYELDLPIYVIDDKSTDNTSDILNELLKENKISLIQNTKNLGAGLSTLELLKKVRKEGFKFLIKVDGDGQFSRKDIKKIKELLQTSQYDFIKSNRFWSEGIKGKIPNKRYFGNLIATMLLQLTSGTNKLFDPLNGLFAVNVKFLDIVNYKVYPKRYGYPYYFSALCAINNFRIFQINNTVSYNNQSSQLSSIKMAFTLTRLVFHFHKIKIRNKLLIGKYQRSAFLDILFIASFFVSFTIFVRFILIFTPFKYFDTSYVGSWALILLTIGIFTVFIFIESFKEEKEIRNEYIHFDE